MILTFSFVFAMSFNGRGTKPVLGSITASGTCSISSSPNVFLNGWRMVWIVHFGSLVYNHTGWFVSISDCLLLFHTCL